jgi:hypothetical protein
MLEFSTEPGTVIEICECRVVVVIKKRVPIWLEFCQISISCHISKQSHKRVVIVNRAALVSPSFLFSHSSSIDLLT